MRVQLKMPRSSLNYRQSHGFDFLILLSRRLPNIRTGSSFKSNRQKGPNLGHQMVSHEFRTGVGVGVGESERRSHQSS